MKRAALLLLALLGCRKTVETTPPPPSPAAATPPAVGSTAPSSPPAAGVVVETAEAGGPTGDPYAELPVVTGVENLGSDRVVGFSKDDRYLGFTISTCDPCPEEFHFRGPGVPALDFGYLWDPGDEDDARREARKKKNDAMVESRLASLGAATVKDPRVLRGPFPYPDLVFAMRSEKGAGEHVTLLVGAHVSGEAPVYPMRIPLGTHPLLQPTSELVKRFAHLPPAEREAAIAKEVGSDLMHDAQLAYVDVTKDGRDIGAVGIARGDYWWESGGVARMPTAAFVAQVYNDTGMKRLGAGRSVAAADLFAKASAAVPDSALFAYNLACAAAREDDPRAGPALASAIARSPTFQARARKDPDFDRVRAADWFTRLTR